MHRVVVFRILVAALTLTVSLASGSPAGAQAVDPGQFEEARALFERGNALAARQRWPEALEAFQRSLALAPRPSTRFNVAMSLLRVGQVRAALGAFDEYLRTAPDTERERVERAQRMREEAREALATLTLEHVPSGAAVLVDGVLEPGDGAHRELRLDPGLRRVEVRTRGGGDERFEVTLSHGSRTTRVVQITDLSASDSIGPRTPHPSASIASVTDARPREERAPPVTSRPWFWGILGGSAALVTVAVVLGVVLGAPAAEPFPSSTGVVLHAIESR